MINHMIQYMKQLSGKLSPNVYTSVQHQSSASQMAYMRQLQKELKKESVLNKRFEELEVVVFDIETTGFYPDRGDKILSIGAVKVRGTALLEEEGFYSLVRHEDPLPQPVLAFTGIQQEDLFSAPTIEQVLEQFFYYVEGRTLVAHHSQHEKAFMQHVSWHVLRTNFIHRVIDTSFLIKVALPHQRLKTLDECCDFFDIPILTRHHALEDAKMTAQLWIKNVQRVKELGFHNLQDVYSELAK
ncbi:MAG: 3'-5' exoribonuclease [Bacillaceae bacterium]|nr:3'-5' exoribonuclease [Bacillaceae bacterium]